MTHYKFGDVLLAEFPYSDFSQFKPRPAVVINTELYQQKKHDVLIAAVTSQLIIRPELGEFELSDYRAAGLPKPSAIKSSLYTLHESKVIKQFGSLQDMERQLLAKMLQQIMVLGRYEND